MISIDIQCTLWGFNVIFISSAIWIRTMDLSGDREEVTSPYFSEMNPQDPGYVMERATVHTHLSHSVTGKSKQEKLELWRPFLCRNGLQANHYSAKKLTSTWASGRKKSCRTPHGGDQLSVEMESRKVQRGSAGSRQEVTSICTVQKANNTVTVLEQLMLQYGQLINIYKRRWSTFGTLAH